MTRTRTSDGKADGKAVTFTTNPSSSQAAFATAVAGFTSGDKVSLSYSYEVKNRLKKCIVQQGDISKNPGSVNDVTVPATPASRLYATNADGKPQEFTSTLFDNLNEFTLNIDAGCHLTPITNSTLPSAGGMGTTWKIVGIITLIAALFLAIVALLKKRAMQ